MWDGGVGAIIVWLSSGLFITGCEWGSWAVVAVIRFVVVGSCCMVVGSV